MVARDVPETLRFGRRIDRDREGALQPGGRRQELAPHAYQCRRRERAMIARNEPADDFRLARRLVRGELVIAALVRGDARENVYALDQEILQPVVNLVDASA